ncbi:hypothetical protein T4C_10062 [Trichinella pseudospiralis]|uniref:PiggyBac transposable element-derived protein domain-containing protein n=1 Tax=Trichinella pseudospiralis TaxID=6337 RepID=A0A0V1JWY9_TRIPS|nr:hypothetical protein T4C_10062 [Trichinella pseudospiralis]
MIVGIFWRNKKEVPSELTQTRGREVDSSMFCFDEQLTLLSYIPKRRKCVLLLSTMHHDDALSAEHEANQTSFCFTIKRSLEINSSDGISKFIFDLGRRTQRWPMALWFNTSDCAGLAAFVIWTRKNTEWNAQKSQRRRTFLMECGKNFVDVVLQKLRKAIESLETATASQQSLANKDQKATARRCVYCGRKRDRKVKTSCITCGKSGL